jgi:surface polysaccharide O-acyltransferase-like enzyme
VLTAGGSLLFSPGLSLDDWRSLSFLLVIQPARIGYYAGYFMLGIYAERHGWFTVTGFRPRLAPWGAACVLAGLAYLVYRNAGPDMSLPAQALESVLFSVFCLTALVAGIAFFKRWVDGAGTAWGTLAVNSFGIYYVHPLILYPLAYVILDVHVQAVAKFAFLVVVTLLGSLAVSTLVLKRVPGLRRMF